MAVDPAQVSASSLTNADWIALLTLALIGMGSMALIIYNNVVKKLDRIGDKQDKQGRNITRICTHLGIEEDT